MGGGGTSTSTSTTGSNNPQVEKAISTLGTQLNTQLGRGYKGFEGSLVPQLSSPTQAGIGALTNNPNNPLFSSAVSGALGQQGQIAQGNFGDDPVRERLMQDVSQNVNSSILGTGRFGSIGSGAHSDVLARETASALAPYDYGRQQQAITNLGSLYSMGNMPAAANLQAGQLQDAYNTAQAGEAARLFDVQNNAGWNTITRGTQALSGVAPAAGTVTSNTNPTAPWWQQALGYVAGNAGNAMRMM